MSEVFLDYAKYYDALYKDKNYKAEADFIINLIRTNHPGAKTILNLGCGTGQHDLYLAQAGYEVTGVDLSEQMIAIAREKNRNLKCDYIHGDARSVNLDKKFDIVISLFHVLSYQTSNEDTKGFFHTINQFLKPDGISIIDYWYGPAVLSIKPERRFKTFESEELLINREANTTIDMTANVATVVFDVDIKNKKSNNSQKLHEKHPMRYFFSPEVKLFAEISGMKQLSEKEWMSTSIDPSDKSWAAYSIFKK